MDNNGDQQQQHYDHHHQFSPLLIGLMGIIAGAMMVATYHCITAGCGQRRRVLDQNIQIIEINNAQVPNVAARPIRRMRSPGNVIRQDRGHVFKYAKEGEEGKMCAVCLCDFEEGEEIRMLPECLHLFHVSCVDMWLYSHSNCPLCRASTGQRASYFVLDISDDSSRGEVPLQELDSVQAR